MNLDISSWKKFRLGDLFEIKKGKRLTTADQIPGTTPYIGAIDSNNGVANYIGQSPIHEGNTISLAYNGSVGEAFYQPEPFWATDDVNVLYLKPEQGVMNAHIAAFICTMLKHEKYRFSYGRKWVLESMRDTILPLPATNDGLPDWTWMEDYIRSLKSKPIATANSDCSKKLVDVTWGDFRVCDLFDVKYGINMELNACEETSMEDPEGIAFVARTAENNGVSAYVKPVSGKIPQPAFTITVAGGGSVLSTFLQTRPFYSGRDLYLLIPKEDISNFAKLFVVTALQAEKYRFNYGRQANRTLPYLNLHLPVNKDGMPDWEWMKQYVKSLPYGDRIPQ